MSAVVPDWDNIYNYIKSYSYCSGQAGIETILTPWSANKGTLFRLLGNQLTYEVPVSLSKNVQTLVGEFANLYRFRQDSGSVDVHSLKHQNEFIKEYFHFMDEMHSHDELYYGLVQCVLNGIGMARNELSLENRKLVVEYKGKKVVLQTGQRPMSALSKIVHLYGIENFPNFEEFRLAHSNILTSRKIEGTLCFSIHPLDYMTMSDNDNNWSSCMSWSSNGEYRRGTLEMLNSNNVIVCYMKSKDDYEFKGGIWNNKSWRQLICINKDIIVSGKAYPYTNDELSKAAVMALKELAKARFNWDYKYSLQPYKDMQNIWTTEVINDCRNPKRSNIFFTSEFMYNDMMEDSNTTYWCVRNKPKKQKILSISGKCYCLDCGEEIPWDNDDCSSSLICDKCQKEKCCVDCRTYTYGESIIVNGEVYCPSCYENLRYCPDCGELHRYSERYVILSNEETLRQVQEGRFIHKYHWYNLQDQIDGTEVTTCNACYEKMMANKTLVQFFPGAFVRYFTTPNSISSDFVQSRLRSNLVSLAGWVSR